jgi:AcrR family transcriptional regulator
MSDLQGKILPAALDLYLQKGLSGLSMRVLADKLGVSATAIYRHYRNKEELLHRMIGEAVKVFGTYQFTALTGSTPQERFRLSVEAYLNFALEQSKYYEVIFMTPQQTGAGPLPEDLKSKSLATFQFLVDRVQECMECGYLRKEDSQAVALSIWAHGHGLVSIYLAKKYPLNEENFRRLYQDSRLRMLRGLRA